MSFVLDDETERSNEIGNEGGASGLVFFGMKVELAFDVLKDNKRWYDNILSECGITDPLQIYSGWLDEHAVSSSRTPRFSTFQHRSSSRV
jgi:hypothetical protein